jgi:hypothetical protein
MFLAPFPGPRHPARASPAWRSLARHESARQGRGGLGVEEGENGPRGSAGNRAIWPVADAAIDRESGCSASFTSSHLRELLRPPLGRAPAPKCFFMQQGGPPWGHERLWRLLSGLNLASPRRGIQGPHRRGDGLRNLATSGP